jgi:hypothetical protein
MARNQKLTGVIKGRKITSAQNEGDTLSIRFDDGSTMTVRTAAPVGSPIVGIPVKAVRQRDTTLDLDFENGATMEIKTAEPTSSVMLRDKNHTLEYAD